MSRRGRRSGPDGDVFEDDIQFKYGQVIWANTGANFPHWPARIEFIPVQMNPEYQTKGMLQYPVFCYGTHNIMWLAQDMISENTASNYSKFLKSGKAKAKKDDDLKEKFDAALEELENNPCVKCDLQSIQD